VIIFNRKGSIVISAPRVTYIINIQGLNILVNLSAIDIIASIFSIFCGIIKPLVA
jgi:hypothetical protein